jgi:hypothetical protein
MSSGSLLFSMISFVASALQDSDVLIYRDVMAKRSFPLGFTSCSSQGEQYSTQGEQCSTLETVVLYRFTLSGYDCVSSMWVKLQDSVFSHFLGGAVLNP